MSLSISLLLVVHGIQHYQISHFVSVFSYVQTLEWIYHDCGCRCCWNVLPIRRIQCYRLWDLQFYSSSVSMIKNLKINMKRWRQRMAVAVCMYFGSPSFGHSIQINIEWHHLRWSHFRFVVPNLLLIDTVCDGKHTAWIRLLSIVRFCSPIHSLRVPMAKCK